MTAASRDTDEGDAACFELREGGMKNSRFYGSELQLAISNSRARFVPQKQSAFSIQLYPFTAKDEKNATKAAK